MRRSWSLLAWIAACCLGALWAHSSYGGDKATVTIYPGQEIGPVNPLLFGNNQLAYQNGKEEYGARGSGIWDPEHKRSTPEFVTLARECGLTVSRWPGGCGAHNYNWKKTVGALVDRKDQPFGLPEFMRWCADTKSIALITVPVYWGTARDAADLVEYLNAPNDGANPNGGREWAGLRAADGHPPPYDVIWFEFGNESYHGEHHPTEGREHARRITPQDYAKRYLEVRAAMRAVDPRIRLGALVQHGLPQWNKTVLQEIGEEMDFAIDHTYLPVWGKDADPQDSRILLQAATACGAQLQEIYTNLRHLVKSRCDREDLPWAITEYNGHYVQNRPVPYRQTLANALRNAEHLRIMMNPENHIFMANFWQFANEYWGMIQGYPHRRQPLKKQANFLIYEMYAQHFGTTLVRSRVRCNTWDFPGKAGVRPRHGTPSPMVIDPKNLLPKTARWSITPLRGVQQRVRGPLLQVQFRGRDVNYYHAVTTMPAKPDTWYRVTGMIRTENLVGRKGACFQVGDSRGWDVTHSCAISGEVVGTTEWCEVSVDYHTLADTEAICITARRLGEDDGPEPASGTAIYRIYSVQTFQPGNLGAVPDITANVAKRPDGTVTAMLINTNFDRDTTVEIDVAGMDSAPPARAQAWLMSGSAPWATNLGRVPKVRLSRLSVTATPLGWSLKLPRCSLAAVEIHPPK